VYCFQSHLSQKIKARDKNSWFVKHRYFISNTYLSFFYAALAAMQTIPIVFSALFDVFTVVPGTNIILTCNSQFEFFYLVSYTCVGVLLMIAAIIAMRSARDAYSIKKEFKILFIKTGVISFLTLFGPIFYYAYEYATRTIAFDYTYIVYFMVILLLIDLLADFAVSTVWVWWLSEKELRSEKQKLLHGRAGKSESIGKFISDTDTREQFMEFLVTQFCPENLIFWEVVQDWRKNFLMCPNLREQAIKIYNKFVALNSLYEININYSTRQAVIASIESDIIEITIFDTALQEVEELLILHSFPYFKKENEELDLPHTLLSSMRKSASCITTITLNVN